MTFVQHLVIVVSWKN